MRQATRDIDIVARIGGDEFVVLARMLSDHAGCGRLVRRLLEAIRQAAGQNSALPASIGWALFPDHGQTPEPVTAAADRATYHAKQRGKNGYAGYDPDMARRARRELALQEDLAAALAGDQFRIYYQPKYRARDRRLSGAEALVRWAHPEHGLLLPEHFIPAAEHSGDIDALKVRVLDLVSGQVRQWCDDGLAVPRIAVNLSARRIGDPRLPERVSATLGRYGLNSSQVMFEITESLAIHGMLKAADTFKQFACMGLDVALDAFGTGHSSLSCLSSLPIQQIQIYRSFIRQPSAASRQPPAERHRARHCRAGAQTGLASGGRRGRNCGAAALGARFAMRRTAGLSVQQGGGGRGLCQFAANRRAGEPVDCCDG